MTWKQLGILGICTTLLAFGSGTTQTLHCVAERVAVQQERNLIRKQGLLANALAACPEDMHIHFEKGSTEERLRNYDLALEHYTIAIGLDPSYARAHFGRADVLMNLGNHRAAIEAYETGLTMDPENTRARAALAKAHANYITASPAPLPETPAATQHEAWH